MKQQRLNLTSLFVVAVLLTGLLIGLCPPVSAVQDNDGKVKFQWAFAAVVGPQGEHRLVSVDNDQVLHTGDQLKFYIQPRTRCFVYLFYLSAQGDLAVLLPRQITDTMAEADSVMMVPEGSLWFQLDDDKGLETFHLLVSAGRLEQLEAHVVRHLNLKDSEELKASSKVILSEIKHQRLAHRSLKASAERPVRLGGSFRGTVQTEKNKLPDIRQIAVEISADSFYTRTFTIDHR